jgi:hypothetical protein
MPALLSAAAPTQSSTVMPSSLMAIERNPALRDAARVLDRKLQTLVSRVTGVELDRTPGQMDQQH